MAQTQVEDERAIWPALRRGWRLRCPQCGEGRMLHSYLKVNETCEHCGLELGRARADDGPAYMTIAIVGHLMVAAMLHVYVAYRPGPWTMALVFTLGSVALALYLLPKMKGCFVGIQWAKRMYGL